MSDYLIPAPLETQAGHFLKGDHMAYLVTDSLGRQTLILKKTERAARQAFLSHCKQLSADFGFPTVTIRAITALSGSIESRKGKDNEGN